MNFIGNRQTKHLREVPAAIETYRGMTLIAQHEHHEIYRIHGSHFKYTDGEHVVMVPTLDTLHETIENPHLRARLFELLGGLPSEVLFA